MLAGASTPLSGAGSASPALRTLAASVRVGSDMMGEERVWLENGNLPRSVEDEIRHGYIATPDRATDNGAQREIMPEDSTRGNRP